jgi:hypothetical protein
MKTNLYKNHLTNLNEIIDVLLLKNLIKIPSPYYNKNRLQQHKRGVERERDLGGLVIFN